MRLSAFQIEITGTRPVMTGMSYYKMIGQQKGRPESRPFC
jgi:hypothetical protein